MKKLFLGAIGLLALASCSNDELIEVNHDGDEIAFNVVTNPVSRASDVYCNNHKPTQFTVWATYDGKQYIDGDNIEFNGTKWENKTGNRYWPADGYVTFFAHHNAGAAFNYNNGAPKIENFTVADNVAEQTDLIYAVKTQSKPTDGKVTLNFRHALSQIVFQAKNTNQNLYVEISGVSVCKVKNTNTFTYPTADTDNNIAHPDGTMDEYDDSWGKWGTATGSEKYSVIFNPVELTGSTAATAQSLTATATPDTDKEFNSNAMLLLPQTSTEWTPTQNIKPADQENTYFLVKCQIWNVAGETVDKANDVCLWGKDGAKDAAIPVALNWTQGKKYIYTFVFGDGNGGYDPEGPNPVLLPITFNVTVDEFVPVDNQDIDMDGPDPVVPTPEA